MTITIGVLHMDELSDAARHLASGYPALYDELFAGTGTELVHLDVHRGDAPASLADADVWVLGGSRHSVYDDLPWIADAVEITRALVAGEHRTVGVCFGHQLMAHALGGTVGPAGRWGIGVQAYRTVEPLPWFPNVATSLELIACHRDQVIELPREATAWSTADYCPIAGIRFGDRAWSVQGHPEFPGAVAGAIYDSRRAAIGDDAVDAALPSLDRPSDRFAVARAIVTFARG